MRCRLEPIEQLLHRQPVTTVDAHPADAMVGDQLGLPLRGVLLIPVDGERPLLAAAGQRVGADDDADLPHARRTLTPRP
ncbi:hypothetical protein PV458_09440 [Streptomyces sp. MN03-5084-2B]|nr:hypothetical protein [Streptomyces sp. MN03-5084-2B]